MASLHGLDQIFLRVLSRKLVNENQVIVVENLAVKNLVKNHTLAKAISDAGWGMFCTMLKYKAEFDAAINIKNEGLRLLALGISATANRGSVNPHGSGRKKSTNSEVAPVEIGSPCAYRYSD
jgi:putative transposase